MKFYKISAACVALAIAGSGTAQADSFASASVNIIGLKWIDTATNLPLVNGSGGNVGSGGQNTGNLAVTLNGTGPAPIALQPFILPGGGQIPFTSQCTGPDCPSANPSAPPNLGPPGNTSPNSKTYSYGDVSLTGAVITITDLTTNPTTGAFASYNAQSDLSNNASVKGKSSTDEGAITSFKVTATQTFSTRFILDYSMNLLANVASPFSSTDNAKASSFFTIQVTDINNSSEKVLIFTPVELNRTVSVTAGNPLVQVTNSGSLQSDIYTLDKGDNYQFTITANIQAEGGRGSTSVPEPDSLALFGIGMVGLMVGSLRKKKA